MIIDFKEKKNLFKVIELGLGIVFLLCFLLPFINVAIDSESSLKISGFQLIKGMNNDLYLLDVNEFSSNVYLYFPLFLTLVVAVLAIFDFKNFEIIKKIVCVLVSCFNAVVISNIKNRFYIVNKVSYTDQSSISYGYGYSICLCIVLGIFLMSVYDLLVNGKKLSEEKRIIGCLENNKLLKISFESLCYLIITFGLFFAIVRIGNNLGYIDMSLIRLLSKYDVPKNALGFIKTKVYKPTIIFFVSVIVSIALRALTYLYNKKIFKISNVIILAIAFSFIVSLEDNVSIICIQTGENIYSAGFNGSLTIYGSLVFTSCLLLLLFNILEYYKEYGLRDASILGLTCIGALVLTNMYQLSVYTYNVYTSDDKYNEVAYSLWKILKSKDILGSGVKLQYFYILIFLELAGLVCSFVPFKEIKIKYLVLFLIYVVSFVLFVMTYLKGYNCLTGDNAQYCRIECYEYGYIHGLFLLICASSYLYLGYVED